MLVLVGVSVWQTAVLIRTAQRIERSDAVIADANAAERLVIDMETGLRGFRLTNDAAFLDPYTRAEAAVDGELAGLVEAAAGEPDQVARAEGIRESVAAWRAFATGVLGRAAAGVAATGEPPPVDVPRARRAKGQMDAVRGQFDAFIGAEERRRDARALSARRAAWMMVSAAVALTALAGAGLAWFSRRQLNAVATTYRQALDSADARAAEVRRLNDSLEARVAERTEALADERAFFAGVLDNLLDGVAVCDAGGRLTLFNRAITDQVQRPLDGDTPPERWAEVYHVYQPDGRTLMPADQVPLARAYAGEVVRDAECVFAPPGHPPRHMLISGRSFRDEAGALLGAFITTHDVTAVKAGERRLRASVEELARSNRELQDFASVASHDLQEPLRKIQAFGDRLRTKCAAELSDQGRDYLDRMQAAAGRMSTLIEDLLTFSRVTTRAQPFAAVDLNAVAREVVEDLEVRIERSGGRVDLGPLPTVRGDATQLRQLLQNLISNGLKFCDPARPPVVTVRQTESGDESFIAIGVVDNGIGFDEKYLGKIFNIFQRLHARGEYEGTGIGLAVCRKICERHGGSIDAAGRPGEGATFTVRLPHRPAEPGEMNELPEVGNFSAGPAFVDGAGPVVAPAGIEVR